MNASLARRLRFIDFQLDHYGSINRAALMDYFGLSPAQASRDIKAYKEAAPGNMTFDEGSKIYLRSHAYTRSFP
jgi:predicted DNA-binding transcriptional regulator YafY